MKEKKETFKINVEYEVGPDNGYPVHMSELFAIAQTQSFDEVQVFFTSHNGVYCKNLKKTQLVKDYLAGFL